MTNVIDGKKIAGEIIEKLKQLSKPNKFLAIFIASDDPIILNFVKQKEKTAFNLGVDFRVYRHPESIKNDELRKEVLKIAKHKSCGGAIVQLPLPSHLNKHYVMNVIPKEKDVDVLGERALGALYTNRNPVLPPAIGAIQEILEYSKLEPSTKKVAIIGSGFLVGKPAAVWFAGKCKEVLVLSRGSDLNALKEADIVISGVGHAGLIVPGMLKDGALVIDFGYSIDNDGNMSGDFNYKNDEIDKLKNTSYTPTPGGTGPMVVAKVFDNFYKLTQEK